MMSQKKDLFVPVDYKVPTIFETDEFRLRMLSIEDVEMDYEAVMDSVTHLSKVWPDSGWPEGLTLQKNLIDLAWHQKEFERRTSFAYTVVTLNEERVIGCVYFYPTVKREYDAEIFLWVRTSEIEKGLDERLFSHVVDWLDNEWPFKQPAYPGRLIGWDDWNLLPDH